MRRYPSRTQNTLASAAMPAPPRAGCVRLHTSRPVAHSRPPAASSARLHLRRGIRSTRLMAVPPSRSRAPRYSLPAPATTRTAPQLTTQPATIDDATWLTSTASHLRPPAEVEAEAGRHESGAAQIEVNVGHQVARGLLGVLPEPRRHAPALSRMRAGRVGQAAARLRLGRPDGAGGINASRLAMVEQLDEAKRDCSTGTGTADRCPGPRSCTPRCSAPTPPSKPAQGR